MNDSREFVLALKWAVNLKQEDIQLKVWRLCFTIFRFLNTIWAFDITLTDNGSHAAMIGIELAEKRSKIDQILTRTKK